MCTYNYTFCAAYTGSHELVCVHYNSLCVTETAKAKLRQTYVAVLDCFWQSATSPRPVVSAAARSSASAQAKAQVNISVIALLLIQYTCST
jgi:hypothetical protein